MRARAIASAFLLLGWLTLLSPAWAEQRFPPPEFESGYQLPLTQTPAPRHNAFQYLDVAVLIGSLGLAVYLVHRKRSRKAVAGLSLFSLAYFGFYRQGCVCAIGSIQNVSLALFDSRYALPLTVLVFFVAPIVVALFAGRAFCAAVCPHGALQDLVLLKPVKVPAWLESGLGVLPFLYLGAAVAFAATGSAFLICRYDPFIPLFRMSGSFGLLLLGGVFLLLSVFVGRPYCRFLCPYGALLKLGAKVSKWRVTVTPDVCTQCRLCENSCPYGALQEPASYAPAPQTLTSDRRRLAALVLLLPVLILAGGWAGSKLTVVAARLHPTVSLAEDYLAHQKKPVDLGVQTAPALAMRRAAEDPKALLTRAVEIRSRFTWAGWLFGAWSGLMIGLKLIGVSMPSRRTDYEPDRGACLACARCFKYCPSERVRSGLDITRDFSVSANGSGREQTALAGADRRSEI